MNCGSCPVCGAKSRLFRSFASGTGQFDLRGKRWYQFAPEIEQCRTCRTRLVPMRETRPWVRTLIASVIALIVVGQLLPAFFLDANTRLPIVTYIVNGIACTVLVILSCNRRHAPMATGDDKRPGSAATRP